MPEGLNEKVARDEIWKTLYKKWYDSYFNEIDSNRLVSRWQALDDVTKVMVALTGSGSIVAGWTLWNQPGVKFIWVTLAGASALLSIITTSLGVASRLKDWGNSKREFSVLRLGLEAILTKIKINPDFPIAKFSKLLEDKGEAYVEAVGRIRNDFMNTDGLKRACQAELDKLIEDQRLWK